MLDARYHCTNSVKSDKIKYCKVLTVFLASSIFMIYSFPGNGRLIDESGGYFLAIGKNCDIIKYRGLQLVRGARSCPKVTVHEPDGDIFMSTQLR